MIASTIILNKTVKQDTDVIEEIDKVPLNKLAIIAFGTGLTNAPQNAQWFSAVVIGQRDVIAFSNSIIASMHHFNSGWSAWKIL